MKPKSAFGRAPRYGGAGAGAGGATFSGSAGSSCPTKEKELRLSSAHRVEALHPARHLVQLPQELPAEPLWELPQTGPIVCEQQVDYPMQHPSLCTFHHGQSS
jgi:hypothetical protein